MDAVLERRAWPKNIDRSIAPRLLRFVIAATLVLVALLGLFVLARRAAGGLVEPLPPLASVVTGAALATLAAGTRRILIDRRDVSPATHRRALQLSAVVSLALVPWAVGLAIPGAGGGMLALWGLLVVEEGWSWEVLLRRGRTTPSERAPQVAQSYRRQPELRAAEPGIDLSQVPTVPDWRAESDDRADLDELQRIMRRRLDGQEIVEGCLQIDLAPGQRHASAHVAICPPLPVKSLCHYEQSSGPEAEVKLGQQLAHGVRFDIKLARAAAAATRVAVDFSILPPRVDHADGKAEDDVESP